MLIAQAFHYFIQGNRIEALDDFHPVSRRQLHRLLLNPLKEIPLNASYVDLYERTNLIFPFHDESSLAQDLAVAGDRNNLPRDEFAAVFQCILCCPL